MKLFKGVSRRLDNWDLYGIKRMRILLVSLVAMTIFYLFQSGLPDSQIVCANADCDLIYGALNNYPEPEMGEIKRGDSLEILGYRGEAYGFTPTYWVQTSNGERGEVSQFCVDTEFLVLKKIDSLNLGLADTVKIIPNSRKKDSYIVITSEGKNAKIDRRDLDDFVSVRVNESLSSYERRDMRTFMSRASFERNFIGEEMDESYADYIRKYGNDSTVVRYGIRVLCKEDDFKGFFNPVVRYDSNGVAQSYTLTNEAKMDGSGKILASMPLSNLIVDCFGWAVGNKYGYSTVMKPTSIATGSVFRTICLCLFAVVAGSLALIWIFLMNHLFLAIAYTLLPFKAPLGFLSNKALYISLLVLLALSSYVWFVLMLVDGRAWWILLPIMLYTSYRLYNKYYKSLIKKPVFRCDNCKAIGEKYLDSRKFLNNRIEVKEVESVESTQGGSRVANTVTTYSDGSKRNGTKSVSTRTTNYVNIEYTINVDVYGATYICGACENSEYIVEEDRKIISKKVLGRRSVTRDA